MTNRISIAILPVSTLLLALAIGSVHADTADQADGDPVVPVGGGVLLDIPAGDPVDEEATDEQTEELEDTVAPVLSDEPSEPATEVADDEGALEDVDPIIAELVDDRFPPLPPADDTAARLDWIEQALEDRLSSAHLWRYGWGSIFLGATVGQVAMGYWGDPEASNGNYVGAGTALIGTIGQVITGVDSGQTLKAVRACRQTADPLPCAERALLETAASERSGFHWMRFVEAALVSGSGAAIMYWYFDDPGNALVKLGMGAVVSTAKVLTLPRHGRRTWDAYQREYDLLSATPPPAIEWSVGIAPQAVFLQARF